MTKLRRRNRPDGGEQIVGATGDSSQLAQATVVASVGFEPLLAESQVPNTIPQTHIAGMHSTGIHVKLKTFPIGGFRRTNFS